MNLDSIMSNIYGEASSQRFDKVSLLKTHLKIARRGGNIKFVDSADGPVPETAPPRQPAPNAASESYSLSGGKRTRGGGPEPPIVNDPMHIKDNTLQEFINVFHLYYTLSNAHTNTILVIPSSKVLEELKDDYYSKMKAEGITDPSSKDASLFAAKHDGLAFKNYIFDVYGRESENNEGFEYKLPSGFPNPEVKVTIRRTNRANNVYYFKADGDKVEVSANRKMTKPVELKIIGKCDRSGFVFKGDLPNPEGGSSGKSNVVTASLTGGAKRAYNKELRNYFDRLLIKHHNNVQAAAEDFIPSVMLSEVACTGNISKAASRIASHCSADIVHSAMSILFSADDEEKDKEGTPVVPEVPKESFSPADKDAACKAILDHYVPNSSSFDMQKASNAIRGIYAKSTESMSAYDASRSLVSGMMSVYGRYPVSMFKADVATAILSSRRINNDTMSHIYAVADSINDIVNRTNYTSQSRNPLFREQASTHRGISSALTNTIYNALSFRPFIGINAKRGVPMFMRHNVTKSIMSAARCGGSGCGTKSKGKKRKIGKKAFEDNAGIDSGLNLNVTGSNVFNFEDSPEEGETPEPEVKETPKDEDKPTNTVEPESAFYYEDGNQEPDSDSGSESDSGPESDNKTGVPKADFSAFLED